MDAIAMINGALLPAAQASVPIDDPAFTSGWAVFETLGVNDQRPNRLALHLERLEQGCRAARVPWPGAALIASEVEALAKHATGAARLRVTLSVSGLRALLLTPVSAERKHMPIRAARGPAMIEPFLGGAVKHTSRAPWMAAVARSGVDEVLLVDDDGDFTEGTTSGVLAVIDGALWTRPADGRILESTTVTDLLARAQARGIAVVRRAIPAGGGWQALYIASSTRDLCPVVQIDGADQPGWDVIGLRLR